MTSFPDHARVVIVGGGVVGLSTAYHLAKAGIRDVVLVERHTLTSGTTWHSAAGVRALRSSRNLTELIRHSIALYSSLEAETGQATGWTQPGSLGVAKTGDRLVHLKRQAALGRAYGVETRMLTPEEAGEIWPLLRIDDLVGAVFSPGDGRVNPSDLCAALAKGFRIAGGTILEDTRVTGIATAGGRVAAVDTTRGRIGCEIVVNCAGLWARDIARMAGQIAPLYPCEHFYLLTKPIPSIEGHLPMLGAHDEALYCRDDVGGLLVGCFEPHARPVDTKRLPDAPFLLLDEDWDHFEPVMHAAIHRIPALETAEVRMLLNGPEGFSFDERFLLGESPELPGFFYGCGMSSMGMASAGGAGRALAEWIVEGEPTMDLWPVDVRRFSRVQDATRVLAERAPEILGRHYAIAYPHRDHDTARNLRLSPLHHALAARGARFRSMAGWERGFFFAPDGEAVDESLTFGRPGYHHFVAAEHTAAREAVALFDQSTFGKIRVEGPDAEALLQNLCTADMEIAVGRIAYTGLLNARGGFESDLVVLRLSEDAFLLLTGTTQAVRDAHWIRRHLGERRAVVTDVTSAYGAIGVMGPAARTLLGRLGGDDLSRAAFPFFSWREIEVGPVRAIASRLSYVGELGFELLVPAECAEALYRALVEAGEGLGLRDAGSLALSGLRIEKAMRAWGRDLTPDVTPLETGLMRAVKLDRQIPFVGREALLRQRDAGIAQTLASLVFEDETAVPLGDEPILLDGRIAGQMTSAAYGHTLGRPVGLGFVRLNGDLPEALEGTAVEVDIAGIPVRARLTMAPPYDPSGARMRA